MTVLETVGDQSFYVATSVADAVATLVLRAPHGVPLAGATWIMRSPIRQEHGYKAIPYVAIGGIEELRRIVVTDKKITIGACATHAELVAKLSGLPDCQGLADAAGSAANPAIRRVATVGGNLCAVKFAASDLAPALLAIDAQVELLSTAGAQEVPMERFLQMRSDLGTGVLLGRVTIDRTAARSAHARLPLRKAGDYPVAIISMSATLANDGTVEKMRIAIGSVEPVARRWQSLESGLTGHPLDAETAYALATAHSSDFNGRDAVEAPGWYRVQVLPSLVRKAVHALQARL